jgi:hypothetical protein
MNSHHHHIISVSPNTLQKAGQDLPDELRVYEGELEDTLVEFKKRAGISTLWIYPNFQYGWLSPPTGWVGQIDAGRMFSQHGFVTEKHRCITVIQLADSPLASEISKIEDIIRQYFPRQSNVTWEDRPLSGFSPGIGERGCQLGIYETQVAIEDKDEIKKLFYVVAHTSLPDLLIDEIQEHDRALSKSCLEYELNGGTVKRELLQKAEPRTYQVEFSEEGFQQRMLDVAKQLSIRCIIHFCQLTGLSLMGGGMVPVLNEEGKPVEFSVGHLPVPNVNLLEEAIKVWPKGSTMCPFSQLPQDPQLDKLKGYNIGLAVKLALRALDGKESALFLNKHNLKFDPVVYTVPSSVLQTVYNTHVLIGGELYQYSNCAPLTEWGEPRPLIVQKGLELGFEIYNFDAINGKVLDEEESVISNGFGSAYPICPPFKKETRVDPPAPGTIFKFFSWKEGGRKYQNILPAQIKGRFDNLSLNSSSSFHLLPPEIQRKPLALIPVIVLLSPSPPPGAIYTYDDII